VFAAEGPPPPDFDFPENAGLALAAAGSIGVDRETAVKGMAAAGLDFGGLRIRTVISPLSGKSWHFGSLFAANEPESTRIALDRVRSRVPFAGCRKIALLNLRADRASGRAGGWRRSAAASSPDSTGSSSWRDGSGPRAVALSGGTGGAGRGGGRRPSAKKVMAALWPMSADETIVIGAGNIAGIGGALVDYWDAAGKDGAC
jgi:hypothetical protein